MKFNFTGSVEVNDEYLEQMIFLARNGVTVEDAINDVLEQHYDMYEDPYADDFEWIYDKVVEYIEESIKN